MISEPQTKKTTYFEELQERGYSRRDFMKFCTMMAAYLGLQSSGAAQVAKALETKSRLPVIWLHFQECTCCSESFIRSSHPIVADIILDKLSLDYSETLMAASGVQAEEAMQKTMKEHHGEYVLCVEGSVPYGAEGVYCMIGGKTSLDILKEAAEGAKAVICWEAAPATAACNRLNLIRHKQLLFIKSSRVSRSSKYRAALRSAK